MTSVSDHFQAIYQMHRKALVDLNRLGRDFGEAIAERAEDFTESDQYSYGPKFLVLKKCHTWLFNRPIDETVAKNERVLQFAACVAYFEAGEGRWKVAGDARPELWFFIGKARPAPKENWGWCMETFFNEEELPFFVPRPQLGGQISRYSRKVGAEEWDAVCLGLGLEAIQSPEELVTRAVDPLLAAARTAELL